MREKFSPLQFRFPCLSRDSDLLANGSARIRRQTFFGLVALVLEDQAHGFLKIVACFLKSLPLGNGSRQFLYERPKPSSLGLGELLDHSGESNLIHAIVVATVSL